MSLVWLRQMQRKKQMRDETGKEYSLGLQSASN